MSQDREGAGKSESCEQRSARLSRPQKNEVIPTWEPAPPDKDIEPDNYSYGQKGYGRSSK
jgi:hypothetical protein